MSGHPIENIGVATAFITVDADTAGITSDYVSMKGYSRCLILLQVAAWPADTAAVTLLQATAVAGTAAKALSMTRVWNKTGLVDAAWAETTVTSDTFDIASNVDNELYAILVEASDLDVANGFDCIAVSVADPGTATSMVGGTFLLFEPRYAGAASLLLNPIVD